MSSRWGYHVHSHVGRFRDLATVLDCFSKKVVGYALAEYMLTKLIITTRDMVTRTSTVRSGEMIFHSDRRSHYPFQ